MVALHGLGAPAPHSPRRHHGGRLHAVKPLEDLNQGPGLKPFLETDFQIELGLRLPILFRAEPLLDLANPLGEVAVVTERDKLHEEPALKAVRVPDAWAAPVHAILLDIEELLNLLPQPVGLQRLLGVLDLIGDKREETEILPGFAEGLVSEGRLQLPAAAHGRTVEELLRLLFARGGELLASLDEPLKLEQVVHQPLLVLCGAVPGIADVDIEPAAEGLRLAGGNAAATPLPDDGQLLHDHFRGAMDRSVERADGGHRVEPVAQLVDDLPNPEGEGRGERQELHAVPCELRHVRLAVEAVVRNYDGLVDVEALELADGVLDGDDVRHVPRLLREGDGLAVIHRVEREQLDGVQPVAVLVESLAGLGLPRAAGRNRGRVEGDARGRLEPCRPGGKELLLPVAILADLVEELAAGAFAQAFLVGRRVADLPGLHAGDRRAVRGDQVTGDGGDLLSRGRPEGAFKPLVDPGFPCDKVQDVSQAGVLDGGGSLLLRPAFRPCRNNFACLRV